MSDPGYYFLPGDYARDTAHLTNDEDLAYRRLLDCYYSRGVPLPESIDRLQQIARVPIEAIRNVADEFFPVNGDGLRHNKRADREIKKRLDWVADQSRKGKLSAEARKQQRFNRGLTTVQPECQPNVNREATSLSSSSSLSLPTPKPTKKHMSSVPSDAACELASFFLSEVAARYPNIKQPNMASWNRDCDKMLRLDNRNADDARDLIRWMAGDFWGTVVLSPAKLREKWDQMQAKRGMSGGAVSCGVSQRDKYADLEEPC